MSLCASHYLPLDVTVCFPLFASRCHCESLTICLSLFASRCHCVPLAVTICLSLFASHCHCVPLTTCLFVSSNAETATKDLQALLTTDPTSTVALNNYAIALMQQSYFKHAVDIYEQILQRDPDSWHIWNNLSLAYRGNGQLQKAESAALQAIELAPELKNLNLLVALQHNSACCYSSGYSAVKDQAAKASCDRLEQSGRELQKLALQNADSFNSIGSVCRWLSVLSEDDTHRQVYRVHGRCSFAKSLQAMPGNYIAALQLGLLATDEGDFASARELFRSAVAANTVAVAPWNNLGITLQMTGELDDAELMLSQALELAPRSHCSWNNLGTLYRQQGKYAEAQNAYDKCLELKPDYAPAYNNLGLLYVALGATFYSNAVYMFQMSHKMDSTLLAAKSNLARLKAIQENEHEHEHEQENDDEQDYDEL